MTEPLLVRLRSGDPQAVEEWFRQYFPRMLRLVERRISDQADAEEVAQEVFVNALRQLPLFRGESQLWTWMQSIAHHEVADYFRKRYAKRALTLLPLGESWQSILAELPHVETHETNELVIQALKQMAVRSQELLCQKYIDGKRVAEIAKEFDMTVKAVESELFRARKEFRVRYAALAQEVVTAQRSVEELSYEAA